MLLMEVHQIFILKPLKKQTRVRFRLDGILHSSLLLPQEIHNSIVARIKIFKLKIDETRIPQDGRFSVGMAGQTIDFRVSTFPTTLGEKVVMRVLNPNQKLVDFHELGLTGRNLEIIKSAIKKPYGMILSTGPTGSGKTTTLAVMVDVINQERRAHIITIEDPVEYIFEDDLSIIDQREVFSDTLSFARALRSTFRQDPDVIMVGEMRDPETIAIAISAAETGHLVFATLHTNSASQTIHRIVDSFDGPSQRQVRAQLSSSLLGIISQRLIPKIRVV